MAARFFQGFGVSPASTVGMAVDTLPQRTKSLPFLNLHPLPGLKHPPLHASLTRFLLTFQLPVIPIAVLGYSFTWYWWVMSVITMVPSAYAEYSPLIQGLLFLGLLVGTLVAEVSCSGALSDRLVGVLARRNGGVRVPEMRLWGVSAGIQIGNTVITSYIVDAYPLQSTSVIIFYAVFLNLSAFANPFFIAQWESSAGWTWTFTTQALVVLVAGTGVLISLQVFGGRLRASAKEPGWVNAEFDS
ncbi:hypothetical protein BO70DRAFT_374789 [Aspergillus heteromorphus CBS 117.55]|uniref:MFS general substrate transporter n=1 Tax=Aspergillus heteromorphus CBS 117.55 TaxID=1448321 RepID=A0A317UZV1_9EURO|nr:uncharacterized protein BO70DRAFT_374789 [Aspergillus heteromorphus CBS 117.55]PWY66087.1 hypothetical protein BO70DRAFT_374789 [Aspergillus heteromorphus CBS 117.55]